MIYGIFVLSILLFSAAAHNNLRDPSYPAQERSYRRLRAETISGTSANRNFKSSEYPIIRKSIKSHIIPSPRVIKCGTSIKSPLCRSPRVMRNLDQIPNEFKTMNELLGIDEKPPTPRSN